jgi:hypothetical protein
MIQYIIIYLAAGVLFNLLYDLLINHLGEEHEKMRFTMFERIFTTLIWPIPTARFIVGIIKTLRG